MKQGIFRSIFLPLVLIALGFVGVKFLSDFTENARPPLPEGYEDSDLSLNGSTFRGYALGFEGLIADWYWMRSLQYLGDKVSKSDAEVVNIDDLRDLNPRLLYPLLKNATDLDPHFIAPYTFGAIVMPAIDTAKAIELTQKGIDNNPNAWRLYQHLAYIYWKLKQYDKAAETYDKGSRIPGAAPFMRLMAASMRSEGGSRETARLIYSQMAETADDDQTRSAVEAHLKSLDALDQIDAVNQALARFADMNGKCPAQLSQIYSQIANIRLPGDRQFQIDQSDQLLDPSGTPYLFDPQGCSIGLDPANSPLRIK